MHQAVSQEDAILSRHYLAEQNIQGFINSPNALQFSPIDYTPQGNVLIVTPQYLKRQEISISSDVEERIEELAVGEFILLLPKNLQLEESYYKSMFEEEITNMMSSPDIRQKMVATVSYLETGAKRFVYNITPISYQQFLSDPIIIVLTPYSTGTQSFFFWTQALQSYFLFNNLETTQLFIEAYGLKSWVGEIHSGYQIHQNVLNNIKREVWTMFVGAILGILTAVLLFNTMNRLYFEEFRRDLFIKRIAGLHFLEIHCSYLWAQLFVFFGGFFISIFFVTNILIAFFVLLLFIGISILQLYMQAKKESKMSMTILKGA